MGEAHQVVLIDPGTHGTVDAAADAGVKVWQVLGTGMDHVDVKYILDRGFAAGEHPWPVQ